LQIAGVNSSKTFAIGTFTLARFQQKGNVHSGVSPDSGQNWGKQQTSLT
jgi:hypothetical protein